MAGFQTCLTGGTEVTNLGQGNSGPGDQTIQTIWKAHQDSVYNWPAPTSDTTCQVVAALRIAPGAGGQYPKELCGRN
jgi:hypothetical protein